MWPTQGGYCCGELPAESVSRLKPLLIKCFPFANFPKNMWSCVQIAWTLERVPASEGALNVRLCSPRFTHHPLITGVLWEQNEPATEIKWLAQWLAHSKFWNVVATTMFLAALVLFKMVPPTVLPFPPSWMGFHCYHQRTETSLWPTLSYLYLQSWIFNMRFVHNRALVFRD